MNKGKVLSYCQFVTKCSYKKPRMSLNIRQKGLKTRSKGLGMSIDIPYLKENNSNHKYTFIKTKIEWEK